jgi:hypothetical protein
MGIKPSALARRIALLSRRWFRDEQPVRFIGSIRPIDDTKLDNN